jgi:hypothetical protein
MSSNIHGNKMRYLRQAAQFNAAEIAKIARS